MNNKDKFLKLVSNKDSKVLENIKWRKENREWLKKSQAIALKVLRKLKENKVQQLTPSTQIELAEQLGISAQQVNKWVRGTENFTVETISKLENVLSINLLDVAKPLHSKNIVHKSHKEDLTYSMREKTTFTIRTTKNAAKVIPLNQRFTTPSVTKAQKFA